MCRLCGVAPIRVTPNSFAPCNLRFGSIGLGVLRAIQEVGKALHAPLTGRTAEGSVIESGLSVTKVTQNGAFGVTIRLPENRIPEVHEWKEPS